MAHSITPSADGKYVIVKVTGNINRKLAMKYNLEAHALGREMGLNRYLVDLTEARNVETITDNYNFAYRDMRNTPAIDKLACVAVLVSPGDHSHDFVEVVAQNAGLSMTIFTDREKAVGHLLEEKGGFLQP